MKEKLLFGEGQRKVENKTAIFPVIHHRRCLGWYIKRLFFLFLLVFFIVCIRVLFLLLQSEKEVLSAAVATFFIEQGLGVPK